MDCIMRENFGLFFNTTKRECMFVYFQPFDNHAKTSCVVVKNLFDNVKRELQNDTLKNFLLGLNESGEKAIFRFDKDHIAFYYWADIFNKIRNAESLREFYYNDGSEVYTHWIGFCPTEHELPTDESIYSAIKLAIDTWGIL